MTIGIVGLGLMGGSFLKAVKKYTDNTCLVYDRDPGVMKMAKDIADGELSERLSECDFVMISLYPSAAVEYISTHAAEFKKGCILTDCCGVKKYVCNEAGRIAKENGFTFVGAHPMAGVENSGFMYSKADMFQDASMILVTENADENLINTYRHLIYKLGFSKIVETDAETHDHMIAFTSQLAHVVSSAYMKSPSAMKHYGFSAGSFKDMTRVAKLNEKMWTELFLENSDFLADEIDLVIETLKEYSSIIRNKEENRLLNMLKDGSDRKKAVIESERKEREDAAGKS